MAWLTGCIECGKSVSKNSTGRCKTCSNKLRKKYPNLPRWKREDRKEYQREYMRTVYKEKKKELDRKYVSRLRREVLELLGNKCQQCGYSGLALQIDHVNNDGSSERKKFRSPNATFLNYVLRKIKTGSGSKNYQLLCANCNYIKELKRRGHQQ